MVTATPLLALQLRQSKNLAKQLPSTQALSDELCNLIDAARLVVERWGNGDLADAVNGLRVDAKHAQALLGEETEWPGD